MPNASYSLVSRGIVSCECEDKKVWQVGAVRQDMDYCE